MDHAAQSSPPEDSQATEAVTSQLLGDLPNTERIGSFIPNLISLSCRFPRVCDGTEVIA
jgi:hypothetical protein